MATAASKTASFAFTLPLSCSICLGKVKSPVVCPNQHGFCSDCIEVWLKRNKQCPTCRVEISKENPFKPVLGGLSEQIEQTNEFSSREMRRTRLEMLFKDYESEIERLQRQNEQLTGEVRLLRSQQSMTNGHSAPSDAERQAHEQQLQFVSRKLENAAQLNEDRKREAKKLKEDARQLQDENDKLVMENRNLRAELEHRSPRKFGRTAMAAMDSRLTEYTKEISALKKALNRSDQYIEELEAKVQAKPDTVRTKYDKHEVIVGEAKLDLKPPDDSSLIMDDSELFTLPRDGGGGDRSSRGAGDDDTFQLELPSPADSPLRDVKAATLVRTTADDTRDFSVDDTMELTTRTSAANTLNDDTADVDKSLETPSPLQRVSKKLRFNCDINVDDDGADDTTMFNSTKTSSTSIATLPPELCTVMPRTQKAILSLSEETLATTHQHHQDRFGSNGNHSYATSTFTQRNVAGVSNSGADINVPSLGHYTSSAISHNMSQGQARSRSDVHDSSSADLDDCMALFERAERKVEQQQARDSDVMAASAAAPSSRFHSANAMHQQRMCEPTTQMTSSRSHDIRTAEPSWFAKPPSVFNSTSGGTLSLQANAVGGKRSVSEVDLRLSGSHNALPALNSGQYISAADTAMQPYASLGVTSAHYASSAGISAMSNGYDQRHTSGHGGGSAMTSSFRASSSFMPTSLANMTSTASGARPRNMMPL